MRRIMYIFCVLVLSVIMSFAVLAYEGENESLWRAYQKRYSSSKSTYDFYQASPEELPLIVAHIIEAKDMLNIIIETDPENGSAWLEKGRFLELLSIQASLPLELSDIDLTSDPDYPFSAKKVLMCYEQAVQLEDLPLEAQVIAWFCYGSYAYPNMEQYLNPEGYVNDAKRYQCCSHSVSAYEALPESKLTADRLSLEQLDRRRMYEGALVEMSYNAASDGNIDLVNRCYEIVMDTKYSNGFPDDQLVLQVPALYNMVWCRDKHGLPDLEKYQAELYQLIEEMKVSGDLGVLSVLPAAIESYVYEK